VDERIASEWNGQSDAVINEKIGRRDEKSLAQVLRPDAPRTGGGYGAGGDFRTSRSAAPRVSPASSAPMRPLAPRAIPSVETPTRSPVAQAPSVPETKKESAPEPVAVSVIKPAMDSGLAPASAPVAAEPTSVAAPKQFIRPKVDIDELRRSITESLKKQAEGDAPAATPAPAPEKAPK
jgi:hypothetical protein